MDNKDNFARYDRRIDDLERRIALLTLEPRNCSSGLLGAELLEHLQRTLQDLRNRRAALARLDKAEQ